MKRNALRTLCLIFVLSLCLPLVACDMQFGGLVGELIGNNQNIQEEPPILGTNDVVENIVTLLPVEPETEIFTEDVTWVEDETIWDGTTQGDTVVDGTLVEDSNDVIEPPVVVDPVTLHISFDELQLVTGETTLTNAFFAPGTATSWDLVANVDDYKAECLVVHGWVAFFAPTIGTYGYQIDDQEPVYSSDFTIEAEEPVHLAATAIGAKSASRMRILIPIRDLSGTHTVKALVKDDAGTIEVITEFTLNKAVDPHAPLTLIDATTIYNTSLSYSHDIETVKMLQDGFQNNYVQWIPLSGDHAIGDPYVNIFSYQQGQFVTMGGRYLAIKCRIDENYLDRISGTIFIGSSRGPTGQGDMYTFSYKQHTDWQLVIIDLAEIAAINQEYTISFLRLDFYNYAMDEPTPFDIAYIATFNTPEDALLYDEDHPYSKE